MIKGITTGLASRAIENFREGNLSEKFTGFGKKATELMGISIFASSSLLAPTPLIQHNQNSFALTSEKVFKNERILPPRIISESEWFARANGIEIDPHDIKPSDPAYKLILAGLEIDDKDIQASDPRYRKFLDGHELDDKDIQPHSESYSKFLRGHEIDNKDIQPNDPRYTDFFKTSKSQRPTTQNIERATKAKDWSAIQNLKELLAAFTLTAGISTLQKEELETNLGKNLFRLSIEAGVLPPDFQGESSLIQFEQLIQNGTVPMGFVKTGVEGVMNSEVKALLMEYSGIQRGEHLDLLLKGSIDELMDKAELHSNGGILNFAEGLRRVLNNPAHLKTLEACSQGPLKEFYKTIPLFSQLIGAVTRSKTSTTEKTGPINETQTKSFLSSSSRVSRQSESGIRQLQEIQTQGPIPANFEKLAGGNEVWVFDLRFSTPSSEVSLRKVQELSAVVLELMKEDFKNNLPNGSSSLEPILDFSGDGGYFVGNLSEHCKQQIAVLMTYFKEQYGLNLRMGFSESSSHNLQVAKTESGYVVQGMKDVESALKKSKLNNLHSLSLSPESYRDALQELSVKLKESRFINVIPKDSENYVYAMAIVLKDASPSKLSEMHQLIESYAGKATYNEQAIFDSTGKRQLPEEVKSKMGEYKDLNYFLTEPKVSEDTLMLQIPMSKEKVEILQREIEKHSNVSVIGIHQREHATLIDIGGQFVQARDGLFQVSKKLKAHAAALKESNVQQQSNRQMAAV
jgi:hypothetical protein